MRFILRFSLGSLLKSIIDCELDGLIFICMLLLDYGSFDIGSSYSDYEPLCGQQWGYRPGGWDERNGGVAYTFCIYGSCFESVVIIVNPGGYGEDTQTPFGGVWILNGLIEQTGTVFFTE